MRILNEHKFRNHNLFERAVKMPREKVENRRFLSNSASCVAHLNRPKEKTPCLHQQPGQRTSMNSLEAAARHIRVKPKCAQSIAHTRPLPLTHPAPHTSAYIAHVPEHLAPFSGRAPDRVQSPGRSRTVLVAIFCHRKPKSIAVAPCRRPPSPHGAAEMT